MKDYDAIVVGSGPNGLTAAIVLAHAGLSVLVREAQETLGGGVRSAELTLPGFTHDVCSAIYPLAVGSPFLRGLELDVEWVESPSLLAHPFDDRTAVTLERSIDATATQLRADEDAYRRLVGPLVRAWPAAERILLAPLVPPAPRAAAGLVGALGIPGSVAAARDALAGAAGLAERAFEGQQARAFLAANAAH